MRQLIVDKTSFYAPRVHSLHSDHSNLLWRYHTFHIIHILLSDFVVSIANGLVETIENFQLGFLIIDTFTFPATLFNNTNHNNNSHNLNCYMHKIEVVLYSRWVGYLHSSVGRAEFGVGDER
jgi:mannosyltransferase OCH1-like enzyme